MYIELINMYLDIERVCYMIITTEFGNFGNYKDLQTFMKIEGKSSVFVFSADCWGIECLGVGKGTTLSLKELDRMITLT